MEFFEPIFDIGARMDADICLVTPYFRITNLIAERKGMGFLKNSTFQGGNRVFILLYEKGDNL